MTNISIPVTKIHSYNVSVAADVGINAAVVFYNICFWVEENHANRRNFINGKYWTYNTVKALHTIFPEMTGKQIEYALKKLKDGGYIESAILSEDTRDRTNWYAVCDFKKWILHEKPAPQEKEVPNEEKEASSENSEMHSDDSAMFNNIYNNIDTGTDNKQSNDNQTNNKPTDNSHDKYALEDVKRPSSKGDMYASVPEEHKDASPKKQSRYIPLDYTEEQLIEHIRPTIEENLKTVQEDCGMEYNPKCADDIIEIVTDFFEQYREKTGHRHKILPDATLINIMYQYFNPPECLWDRNDPPTYSAMIEKYLDANFNARGGYDGEITLSISHFMSDKIRENCYHRSK